jgi:hypothetical protein
MSKEGEPVRLTAIHINLVDQVVTLEAQDGRRARYAFGRPQPLPDTTQDLPDLPIELEQPEPTSPSPSEQQPAPPAERASAHEK